MSERATFGVFHIHLTVKTLTQSQLNITRLSSIESQPQIVVVVVVFVIIIVGQKT